ncbi:hypothetical protein J5751_07790 [bacterium]|nr:hypothetical protein [bacterium]
MIQAKTAMNDNNTNKVTIHFFIQYLTQIYKNIAIVHINAAINAHCNALSQRVGLTLSSCININDAGNAPLFKLSTNSFAVAAVNDPSICAVHPHILD